ncbi:MAG: hypothetical protein LBI18_03295 [Planctomycetaceae bacterium]|jgi:hypothetical protein|nr:hypothetical protein [Planctomycetaceae bacterium]
MNHFIRLILLRGLFSVLVFLLGLMPCVVFSETSESVAAPESNTLSAPVIFSETLSDSATTPLIPPKSERPEPYRVFFPTDSFQKIIGNTVYIPMEFLQLLSRSARIAGPEPHHQWNIERAEYQGSLVHNPLTQEIELADDFKAIFEINLDSENVSMFFPLLPLFQDRAFWDSKPIQPIRRTTVNKENNVLFFNVENEKKGRHRLELALAPKPEEHDKTRRITLNIPKVPNSVLRLKTPQDAPVINVLECLGAVTPNSLSSPNLVAEIGSSGQLAFSWNNELTRSVSTTSEVEQFFRLLAKSTQVEIRVYFRFKIEGGRVTSIHLQTDPRWHRSGPFHCEEYPIDQLETYLDAANPDNGTSLQNEITRLSFRTPVSGILTVSAGFVLRDFNGIGKVRLPQFRALHSRITRSMLAVSADPVMELDYPKIGLGTGFETNLPGYGNGEQPLAEYDLTKTEPSWLLTIRTKNQPPTVKWNQSVRFDDGDSGLFCRGEFSSVREVFLQRFSVPESLRIESIEVRDARQNPVEIRVAETTPDLVTPEKRSHRILFFKRAVSGNYSITIRGNFATKINSHEPNPKLIPFVTFDDVQTEEKLLNIFRTSSVVAEIQADENYWTISEIAPVAPDLFQNSLPFHSWRGKEETDLLSVSESNQTPKSSPETRLSQTPTFSLIPNKPIIQGEQITTISRNVTDIWGVTFDIFWNISGGELDTIRFRWDEQCGSTISLEPAIPFTLEQNDGSIHLVLSQKIPFSGQQHFRIKATLNTSGISVAVPKLIPEFDKAEKIETKTYLILPQYADGEIIPWNLNRLDAVDDATRKQLEEKTAKPPEENKILVPGTVLTVPEGITSLGGTVRTIVVREPVMETNSHLFLQAAGNGTEDFTATITRKNSPSVVSLYDVNFFIRNSGEVLGYATIDLKSRGQDSFLLQIPTNYELIRVTCAGITSKGIKLSAGQWKIDLWSSDYPQRVKIIFRGQLTDEESSTPSLLAQPLSAQSMLEQPSSIKSTPKSTSAKSKLVKSLTLSQLNREQRTVSLCFPVLEGVTVQQTLWTIALETPRNSFFSPFAMLAHYNREDRNVSRVLSSSIPPVSGNKAMQTLLKLNLIRLNNILLVLNSVSAPSPARSEEIKHWFAYWQEEWLAAVNNVEYQTKNFPVALQSGSHELILDPTNSVTNESDSGFIGTILESKNIPVLIEALMQRYQSEVSAKFLPTGLENNRQRPQLFSSTLPFQWCGTQSTEVSYLFGVTETPLNDIYLTSTPSGSHLPFFVRNKLLNHLLLGLAIFVFLLIFLIRFPIGDLFCQFPHFCGIALGLLFWGLFPSGFLGIAILLLTFLSFCYPAWSRHREFFEQKQ